MALAIESGIPVSTWWREDESDLATALELMGQERERMDKANRPARREDEGRQTSG